MVSKPAMMILGNSENIDRQEYVGVVVTDHEAGKFVDPDKRQRLKIRIRGLHDGVPDEDLPWVGKGAGRAGSGGTGSAGLPPAGTKVTVKMKANDPYHLEWGNHAPNTDDTKLEEEFDEDYGHVEGHIDAAGNKMSQNTKDGNNVTVFHHASGTIVSIGNDGTVDIIGAGKVNIHSKTEVSIVSGGKLDISGQGDVVIAAGGTLTLGGSTVKLATGTVLGPVPSGSGGSVSPKSPNGTTARSRPKPNAKV